jgi:hypothetical protein
LREIQRRHRAGRSPAARRFITEHPIAMTMDPPPDWEAIKHAYENTREPLRAIAARFGVPDSTGRTPAPM